MEPIGFIIGLILIAWLNYYLAEQRGRNEFGWAIGGVAFGIFATILLLILGKTKEKEIEVFAEAQKQASK